MTVARKRILVCVSTQLPVVFKTGTGTYRRARLRIIPDAFTLPPSLAMATMSVKTTPPQRMDCTVLVSRRTLGVRLCFRSMRICRTSRRSTTTMRRKKKTTRLEGLTGFL